MTNPALGVSPQIGAAAATPFQPETAGAQGFPNRQTAPAGLTKSALLDDDFNVTAVEAARPPMPSKVIPTALPPDVWCFPLGGEIRRFRHLLRAPWRRARRAVSCIGRKTGRLLAPHANTPFPQVAVRICDQVYQRRSADPGHEL